MSQETMFIVIAILILIIVFREVLTTALQIALLVIVSICTVLVWFVVTLCETVVQMLTGKGKVK